MFAWGGGSCIGCGSAESTALKPRTIEDLQNVRIVDITCGDSHCVALSNGNLFNVVIIDHGIINQGGLHVLGPAPPPFPMLSRGQAVNGVLLFLLFPTFESFSYFLENVLLLTKNSYFFLLLRHFSYFF